MDNLIIILLIVLAIYFVCTQYRIKITYGKKEEPEINTMDVLPEMSERSSGPSPETSQEGYEEVRSKFPPYNVIN